MRIALDVMGTDLCPEPDVAGGVMAARAYAETIVMVGPEPLIKKQLEQHDTRGLSIEIVHADEQITMHDRPSIVMKSKQRSSMHIGMQLVKAGEADAFVTMGNTGAAHAIATLQILRRIPGVKRPALTAIYPVAGRQVIFLDMGANADARPEWLEQFALMGSIYAETALGLPDPRVATLSNGEEEGKGNLLIKDVQARLQTSSLNYVGHVEPAEIIAGKADVVVMDGFVGNIFLKTFETSMRYLTSSIREEVKKSPVSMLGALLMRGVFSKVKQKLDTDEIGGAPLLGVNGVVIIGHGSGSAKAVKNAVHMACLAASHNTIQAIQDGLVT